MKFCVRTGPDVKCMAAAVSTYLDYEKMFFHNESKVPHNIFAYVRKFRNEERVQDQC